MAQKDQITKLQNLDIDLDIFYAIRIYKDFIHLQGNLDILAKRHLENLGYEFQLNDDFLEARKDGVEIILSIH